MSAASNRSKSDQDPSTLLPPYQPYRCQYVTDWVADKTRYQLSVDPVEEAALSEALSRCPNEPITVTSPGNRAPGRGRTAAAKGPGRTGRPAGAVSR